MCRIVGFVFVLDFSLVIFVLGVDVCVDFASEGVWFISLWWLCFGGFLLAFRSLYGLF